MSGREVRVCGLDEVKPGTARRFEVEGLALCVAHCDDGVRAVADRCSHANYSLSEGELDVEGCAIECPKHGSYFSLVTGEPLTFPATQPVAVFTVRLDGDDVLVEIGDAAPAGADGDAR